jgi:hypothetical protein
VLRIALAVHNRNQQRKTAAEYGEQDKERRLDEIGAPAIEPGQRIGTLIGAPFEALSQFFEARL